MIFKIDVPSHLVFVNNRTGLFEELKRIILSNAIDDVLIITDEYVDHMISNEIYTFMSGDLKKRVKKEIMRSDRIAASDDLAAKHKDNIFFIIAVGGGKTLDVAKYIAKKLNIFFFVVPTIVSHDGISSPVSVLTDEQDNKVSLGTKIPSGLIIPMDIIANSPKRFIAAGTGDLISNIYSLRDWHLAVEEGKDTINNYAASLAHISANNIFLWRMLPPEEYFSSEYIYQLIEGLVFSGLSMAMAGSTRPCSGAEHKISHAMDKLFKTDFLHGEQVAFGSIYSAYLHRHKWNELKLFLKEFGLPVNVRDFNLSLDDMVEAILQAPAMRDRYTILEKNPKTPGEIKEILEEMESA
ncbi:MAG: iron-containing alcohol dehydrogenase [Spirochaetes bacterium]|nr:iron-containing alcohol dehydrogenase [Spirochaetota bacterium]